MLEEPDRIRRFRDGQDVDWTAWEVDGRYLAAQITKPVELSPELRDGWVSFESASGERRRLVPIPREWYLFDVAALRRCLERAMPVRVRGTPPPPPGAPRESRGAT